MIVVVTNLAHCALIIRDFKDTSKSKFAIAECAKFLTTTVYKYNEEFSILRKQYDDFLIESINPASSLCRTF